MKFKHYDLPDSLLYTKEHEWTTRNRAAVRVGVTDYAAKTLNDVVYVSVPKVGDKIKQMAVMGTIESIKAVSELYSPLSGEVVSVNKALENSPELVNKSPYEEGWILELKPSAFDSESARLLDAKKYAAHLEALEEGQQHD